MSPREHPIVASPAGRVERHTPSRSLVVLFVVIAGILVLARFYHFRPFLDEPHAFRQAWTAFYAEDFYRSGMNIFLPSIISMGREGHVLIEFAIPEWIAALAYHVTGPTLYVDRLLSVLWFLGSAFFLFRTVALVQDRLLAWLVTLVYGAAPLGIYFSRAVHIDSAALCCGHAMVFAFLRYGQTGRSKTLVGAFTASALGLLIKAPYVFFLLLPALFVQLVWRQRRRALMSLSVFGAALVVAVAWYSYAQVVNRRAPDLSFIRGYEATADRLDFYLGAADQRLSLDAWRTIGSRVAHEITVDYAWLLVPLALIWRRRLSLFSSMSLVWTGGSLVFVLLFFQVSTIHNYYQLPLLAPFALLAATPLYLGLIERGRAGALLRALAVAVLVAYAGLGVRQAFRNYYQIDRDGIRVGDFVQANTTDRDLVVMAFNDAYYLDPRYLYYANRRGWSIRAQLLDQTALDGLRARGATLVVTSDILAPPESVAHYLDGLRLAGTLDIGGHHVFLHRLD